MKVCVFIVIFNIDRNVADSNHRNLSQLFKEYRGAWGEIGHRVSQDSYVSVRVHNFPLKNMSSNTAYFKACVSYL